MDYQEIRDQIQTGDVAFFHHTGLGGRIIEYFTKSKYTHVGVLSVSMCRVFIIEAVPPRVRGVMLSDLGDFTLVQTNLNPSEEVLTELYRELSQGAYSRWECITGFLGSNKADHKWQCSELVKWFLKKCGMALNNTATPGMLHEELIGSGCSSTFITVRKN